MNPLLHWLTSPEWAHIVKALLHSLWQGAVITAALALLLRRITNPETRYRVMLAGLVLLVLTSVTTWGLLTAPKPAVPTISPPSLPYSTAPLAPTGPVDKFIVPANWTPAQPQVQWTAWLALAWLLGTSAMLGRASVKVAGAEKLRRACQPIDDPRITELVAAASRAVKLTRRVRVAVTNQLTSPAVVGVLVPTLILPLSLITMLSPEQLRFVLLHELAHIRRRDYLANLFQLFAEALFFFNPAVWWLSHQIRREREACCDALAIELSGAPADYARTLVSVAETILNPSPAAAPAFGNDRESSSLADRVHRVLVPGYRPSLRLTWRAMLAALLAGGLVLGLLATGTRETIAATAALLEPKAGGATNSAADVTTYVSEDGYTVQMVNPSPTNNTNLAVFPATGGTNPPIEWIRPLPAADTNEAPLDIRTFKISEDEWARISGNVAPVLATNPRQAISDFFASHGVDMDAPGKSVFYSHAYGGLHVRATAEDLDKIETILPKAPVTTNTFGANLTNKISKIPVLAGNGVVGYMFRSEAVSGDSAAADPRREIISKLDRIRLDSPAFDAVPLTEVVRLLSDECKKRDLDKRGINFFVAPRADEPAIGPFGPVTNTSAPLDMSSVVIKTYSPLTDVKLGQMLEIIVKSADKAIQYSIEQYGIIFSARQTNNIALYSRTFKFSSNELANAFGDFSMLSVTNRVKKALEKARDLIDRAGVDLTAPGKSLFYSDHGGLYVRATLEDLDKIESAVKAWRANSPRSTTATSPLNDSAPLFTRTFKVDPNTFAEGLPLAGDSTTTNLTEQFRNFIARFGVDLQAPKALFFNDHQGVLFVRASRADLDTIEQAIQVLNYVPPQVNIRAKFVEVEGNGKGDPLASLWSSISLQPTTWMPGGPSGTNSSTFTGFLAPAQFKVVLRALEQRTGVEMLSMPDVTTVSGRQAQLQVTDMRAIVSGLTTVTASNGLSTNFFQTSTVPFGPTLDVVPYVAADGFTVNMVLIPTVTEFAGYQEPDPALTKFAKKKGVDAQIPLPIYRVRQVATSANAWDGQTIVIGGFTSEIVTRQTDGSKTRKPDPKASKKRLYVFITPTIIDPAGNRVHSDEQIPYTREPSPPQQPLSPTPR